MKKKILYLVETATGGKWEYIGGNYLVKAFSKKEVEKILIITKQSKISLITL